MVMIAGPNGAGKTTFTRQALALYPDSIRYINPDEIAKEMAGDYLSITGTQTRAAQEIADSQRAECLRNGESFCFETVMSHESKIEILHTARANDFKTHLHYVGLQSAALCVLRVSLRVHQQGHGVPAEKIRQRYTRSLALLPAAIAASNTAAIYDNSQTSGRQSKEPIYQRVALFEDGNLLDEGVRRVEHIDWYRHLLVDG